ncbi:MAG: methyltransferase [Terracidiphilus sp.]
MGLIATISEAVSPPRILADPMRMSILADELTRCQYTLSNCARRLGVFPRLGVNFWSTLRRKWEPNENDPVDCLLELLIDGREVPMDQLRRHLSSAFVDTIIETGLAEKDGSILYSRLCLFPCYGKFIVTDRACKNISINQVMWLWGESFILGGMVKRDPRKRAIDLGTGSGVHAILASEHCGSVVCVDISPRALEFARFNAAMNGIRNMEFVLSDLFDSIDGTCDLLLANPPYLPDSGNHVGENFWSGGVDGCNILCNIVRAIPTRLEKSGTANLITLYPMLPGVSIKEQFNGWLQGTLSHYEVLDYTWPVPHYQDLLSEKPFEGDKSAWRFGVVSLRRLESDKGWWKEAGDGWFFREDGSCCVTADHDHLRACARSSHTSAK